MTIETIKTIYLVIAALTAAWIIFSGGVIIARKVREKEDADLILIAIIATILLALLGFLWPAVYVFVAGYVVTIRRKDGGK